MTSRAVRAILRGKFVSGLLMTEMPENLLPLPTMPYDARPVELPLDVEECRTAIWRCRGNLSAAAVLLKVKSARLRKFVQNSPRLLDEVKEAQEQLVDIAEDVAYEALTDEEDAGRRDQMARFVMTNLGKSRGYGTGGNKVDVNLPKGKVSIQWADGSSLNINSGDEAPAEKVIDHQ